MSLTKGEFQDLVRQYLQNARTGAFNSYANGNLKPLWERTENPEFAERLKVLKAEILDSKEWLACKQLIKDGGGTPADIAKIVTNKMHRENPGIDWESCYMNEGWQNDVTARVYIAGQEAEGKLDAIQAFGKKMDALSLLQIDLGICAWADADDYLVNLEEQLKAEDTKGRLSILENERIQIAKEEREHWTMESKLNFPKHLHRMILQPGAEEMLIQQERNAINLDAFFSKHTFLQTALRGLTLEKKLEGLRKMIDNVQAKNSPHLKPSLSASLTFEKVFIDGDAAKSMEKAVEGTKFDPKKRSHIRSFYQAGIELKLIKTRRGKEHHALPIIAAHLGGHCHGGAVYQVDPDGQIVDLIIRQVHRLKD